MAEATPGQRPGRRRPRRSPPPQDPDHQTETRQPGPDDDASTLTRQLTDPAIEDAIRRFVATAPPLPEDLRSRLARMLRTDQCHRGEAEEQRAA
jgi:hypothetical protein